MNNISPVFQNTLEAFGAPPQAPDPFKVQEVKVCRFCGQPPHEGDCEEGERVTCPMCGRTDFPLLTLAGPECRSCGVLMEGEEPEMPSRRMSQSEEDNHLYLQTEIPPLVNMLK